MRILTIGPSPYLLTRNGRINRDLMIGLEKKGHHVESVVWHHDVGYFLPNEVNKHVYHGEAASFEIHPFLGQKGDLPGFAFEAMKVSQPQVVITIGDYSDTDFIWVIKSLYPNLFKWVAIVPTGTEIVNERHSMAMAYADRIVVTTKAATKAFAAVKAVFQHISYGPSQDAFYGIPDALPTSLSLLNMGKNSQMSNVPAFIKAVAESGTAGTLHTNIDDDGDYDIRCLIKRAGLEERLQLPKKYVSVREGLPLPLVNELYNRHHLIVDCSLQSSTALTMLEAMLTGCIPVGMGIGAVGEVLELMPSEFRFSVPYEQFVGPKEEEFSIISVKELVNQVRNIRENVLSDPNWIGEARKAAMTTARIFSKELFVARVSELLETVVASEHKIAVDSF